MDTIADPDISFDSEGICNYYHAYKKAENEIIYRGKAGDKRVEQVVDMIAGSGRGSSNNCIIGISGGVDSTYLALLAKKWGLRPLLVHFDNGWNSELAVKNIEQLVTILGFDLHTYVVEWQEFRDLQLAYLRASVVDIEAITDHAIGAVLQKLAIKTGIRHVLSGNNFQTEYTLPPSWIFSKYDYRNIRSIHKYFGEKRLKSFPLLDAHSFYSRAKVSSHSLLNCVNFDINKVKNDLVEELSWRDYGGKHYESIWTRFYQGHILPVKFGIDKRKAHYSDLIFSGQLSKVDALAKMHDSYSGSSQFISDYDFVLRKLELNHESFNKLMALPIRKHTDFDYIKPLDQRYPFLKPFKQVYRHFWPV